MSMLVYLFIGKFAKRYVYIIAFLLATSTTLQANDCIKCHTTKMKECRANIHFTLKKAINITRKTFGIKDSNVTLQTLPDSPKTIKEPKDLVDDLLKRKCLRCHLTSKQVNPSKNLCLACHIKHKTPIQKPIIKEYLTPQSKCLKCHNGEFIGSDYLGKFPHDYDKSYRSPLTNKGYYPNSKDGIDYHYLAKSYHAKVSCTSCHASWMVNSYNLNLFRDDTPNYKQWKRLTI